MLRSLYAQFLGECFSSVGSIKNYLNRVKLLHLYAGYDFDFWQTFELRTLLRGFVRLNPHGIKLAAVFT